jgi:putative phage-type endonuclease
MPLTHEEWLAARKKGLGGSDMAAVMGLSPWKSRYQLYKEKRGEAPDTEENDAMRWGKLMEPSLRQFYADTTGRIVRLPERILYHPLYPILFANPDGLIAEELRGLELKMSRYSKGWGEPGTAEVPDYYALQCQHYMLVTGFRVWDLVVSISGALPVMYELHADDELHALMIEEALKFWKQVVEGDAPEPVSFSDAVSKFGFSSTAGTVYAGDEAVSAYESLTQVVEQITELEEQQDTLRAKMVVALGENGDTLVDLTGRTLCTFKMAKGRATIDGKQLAIDEPIIYAKYIKIGAPSRRFLLK